jgi:hypothetical protein
MRLNLTAEVTALDPLRADPEVLTGLLEAALPNLKQQRWCFAELLRDQQSLYRALVHVRGGTLGPEAGSDLGTYVGAQLARHVSRERQDGSGAPPPPSPRPPPVTSSGWYALAFAGAPYIQDSRATPASKIIPSVVDAGLLIGAGVSFALAVDYRNQYADNPRDSSVHDATHMLNTGIGLAIAWFGFRIASGANYELFDYWQRDGKK